MDPHSFANLYNRFVERLLEICRAHFRHQQEEEGTHDDAYEHLLRIVDNLSTRLTDGQTLSQVKNAASELDDDVLKNLALELKYFLAVTPDPPSASDDLVAAADEGETIKDSLSSVLTSLPGIVQRLLKILDELLNLIK